MADSGSASSSPLSSPREHDSSCNNSDLDEIDLDEADDADLGIESNTTNSANPLSASHDRQQSSTSPPPPQSQSQPPPLQNTDKSLDNCDNLGKDEGNDGDGLLGKRKREVTPPPRSRKKQAISPPWKKVEAEGPSTLMENGRRKSGRISVLSVQTQTPDAKQMPDAVFGPPLSSPKPKPSSSKSIVIATPSQRSTQNSRSSKSTPTTATPAPLPKSAKPEPKPQRPSKRAPSPPPLPSRQPTRSSRRLTTRYSLDEQTNDGSQSMPPPRTVPRIRLKIATQLSNPCQVKAPKTATTFEDWWSRATETPITEGGLLADDEPVYTAEIALRDAEIIQRIEYECRPGGLLSKGQCSALAPEPQQTPPRQYAHADHLVKAGANLRRLMLAEKQRHRTIAKKLAEACRDRWLQQQPKTAEELEADAREVCLASYRTVLKTLVGTWDNVRDEVNRRRFEEFQVEEQKRVKAALNQAVNLSSLKLAQRTGQALSDEEGEMSGDEYESGMDSEDEADVEGDGQDADGHEADIEREDDDEGDDGDRDDDSDGDDGDDDDNMSSSSDEDEDDAEGDASLTQEQLRDKYANLPGLDLDEGEADKASDADTSDESVDMDDDLGSSEEGSYESDEGGEEDDEEEQGLLGLLFGKSELKKLNQEVEAGGSPEQDGPDQSPEEDGQGQNSAGDNRNLKQSPEEDDQGQNSAGDNQNLKQSPVQDYDQNLEQSPVQDYDQNLEQSPAGDDHDDGQSPKVDSMAVSVVSQEGVLGTSPDSFVGEDDEVCLVPSGATTGKNTPRSGLVRSSAASVKSARSGSASLPGDGDTDPNTDSMTVDTDPVVMDPTAADTDPMATEAMALDTDPMATEAMTVDTISVATDTAPKPENDPPQSIDTTANTPADIPTTAAPSENASTTTTVSAVVAAQCSESPPPAGPKTPIPFLLRGTLREYQHYGLDWLAGLYANRTNGILADEMGLGKTIQTIALLAHLACHNEVWGPHLVIVPTSVMLNWEMEFKKWCPGFKILAYYGSQEERKRKRQGWNNDDVWNVCITSYQLVLQDHQVFRRRRWHYMVLDEAHNIKNFKSQRWQTLLGFNTHSRLLLTGTPLQNNLTELWSLLFFLMPGEQNEAEGFADLEEFRQWFARPESQILESGREKMDDEARAIIAKLHQVLRPYLLRRLKADVERQMPAKYEHVEMCRLSKRQRELYDGFLSRTDTRETLASGNYLSIINCLMQLRKVCNHPDLFVDRPIMTSFRMASSVPSHFVPTEQLIKGRLMAPKPMTVVDIGFLNLVPVRVEGVLSTTMADRIHSLTAQRTLNHHRDIQRARAGNVRPVHDGSTVHSVLAHFEWRARVNRRHELQHNVYVSALRKQQRPIYGKNLIDMLALGTDVRPHKPRPKLPKQILDWFADESTILSQMIPTVVQRATSFNTTIAKFACVTPAVVTGGDLEQLILGTRGVQAFRDKDLRLSKATRWAPFMPKERPLDPWHEARMRLSIQFPDKRLLQYDCGKLQALDRLLRKLQAGGHRALIFTQMTKVLDILEQFLNIHGHKYLRLDGATKVEQRQILTDRFNHDPRILCFILSTRSGGLGINLTGADTVIFYDQDWNPAMDKQCQDRCHRIGQTRDVHIYRLISEHTIEANILRKATQKQMLDDVVIQEGDFTTDYFNRLSVRDVIGDHPDDDFGSRAANAVMDRLLGNDKGADDGAGKVLEQAEDREDVDAAKAAEKETRADDADFDEKPGLKEDGAVDNEEKGPVDVNADGAPMGTIDDYMVRVMRVFVEGTVLAMPRDKKSKKRKRDTRKR